MISSALQRQVWLIDIIMHSPKGLTFQEISERWLISSLNETHDKLSKRTFFSQINSISDNFGINIECDHKSGYLYHVHISDIESGSIKRTLLNSLILSNTVEFSPEVSKRVQISISFGEVNISPFIGAIMKNHCLKIHYYIDLSEQRENNPNYANVKDIDFTYEVEPYGLYFRGIWFLIAKVKQDQRLHIYAVTNLIEIEETTSSFSYPEKFDLKEYVDNFDSDVEIQQFNGVFDDDSLFDIIYGNL